MHNARNELRTNMDIPSVLAEELHRQYRAAEKAMRAPFDLFHDHGYAKCCNKKYFHNRAKLIIKRSHLNNPECLSQAEEALYAMILKRRIAVGITTD